MLPRSGLFATSEVVGRDRHPAERREIVALRQGKSSVNLSTLPSIEPETVPVLLFVAGAAGAVGGVGRIEARGA